MNVKEKLKHIVCQKEANISQRSVYEEFLVWLIKDKEATNKKIQRMQNILKVIYNSNSRKSKQTTIEHIKRISEKISNLDLHKTKRHKQIVEVMRLLSQLPRDITFTAQEYNYLYKLLKNISTGKWHIQKMEIPQKPTLEIEFEYLRKKFLLDIGNP